MPTVLSRPTPRPTAPRSRRCAFARGFTLIEVLVVITISAILLALGVPMFNSTIASMRASEGANALVASLELARSEAIRRGTDVTLCRVAAADATGCSNVAIGAIAAADWAAGWLVWSDVPNDPPAAADVAGVIDVNDRHQYQPPLATGAGPRVQIIPGALTALAFRPDGLRVGGQVVFRIAYPQAALGAALSCRQVTVDGAGRTSAARITC